MKLRCNVCDDTTVEEKCNRQYETERCLSITVSDSVLFWVMSFLQINYAVRMMFCDISDAETVIKWAFLIKFINNDSSAAWESRDRVWKGSILSLKRLNKYNCICMQQQNLCCCLFCATMLFRVCILLLLCRHFVSKFILRCLHFLCTVFIFILFHFCISFQWSKYVNNVIYDVCCILHWLSSYRLSLQNWLW